MIRLLTGPEAQRVLRRSGGRCVAHPAAEATRAVVGRGCEGGAAYCDACLVAMRLVQPPADGAAPTLLPGVTR